MCPAAAHLVRSCNNKSDARQCCLADNTPHCCTIDNTRAQRLIRDRIEYADNAVAHVTVWRVPQPVHGSRHDYKYRLAYVVVDECILRYDNEAGKGDHRHRADDEYPYTFITLPRLLIDFMSDIARWNDESRMV